MLSMLLAYDAAGGVVATLDHVVARDDQGNAIGLIDFAAHEAAGGQMTDIWTVSGASRSKTWPEWIGSAAHAFQVELIGPPGAKWINALVHRTSGFRRERAAIDAAIAAVPPDADGVKDLRPILGGPTRPLQLDATGRTLPPQASGTPAHLPIIAGKP